MEKKMEAIQSYLPRSIWVSKMGPSLKVRLCHAYPGSQHGLGFRVLGFRAKIKLILGSNFLNPKPKPNPKKISILGPQSPNLKSC